MLKGKHIKNTIRVATRISKKRAIIILSSMFVGVLLVVIGITAILSSPGYEKDKQWTASDKITTDKFEISIISVEKRDQVGSGIFESKPAEGMWYLTVHWKFKNASKNLISTAEMPTLQLVDNFGAKYEADLDASISYITEEFTLDTTIFNDFNSGVSVSDVCVFQVPTDSLQNNEYKLLINADKELVVDITEGLIKEVMAEYVPFK
ncbi:DUF4352 domain-containing protein [Clostridium sp.]|uniref:DUF4352 domain-containing protein n=1 Tax=Clostridium sp. TaxID=1506 RepID=UPI002FC96D87